MAMQFLINLSIKGFVDNLEFEVREAEWERAQGFFDCFDFSHNTSRCLLFDTVDGLTVAVNIADVQVVQFPWNAVQLASDQKHKEDDVHVWVRGCDKPISVSVDDDTDALSAFFVFLDSGSEFEAFPGLIDIDGELVRFNATELVLATAPLHLLREGFRELQRDADFDDPDFDDSDKSNDIPF